MDFILKYKKIIIIIAFIAFILIMGYFIYALFFKPTPIEEPAPGPDTTGPSRLPEAETGPGQIVPTPGTGLLPTEPGKDIKEQPKPSATAQGGLTETKALTHLPSSGMSLTKDGNNLQYYNETDGKFYRVNNNGELTTLSNKIFHNVSRVSWSPDKEKAILEYPDGANIVYNFTTDKQITLPKHWKDFEFSPSGNQIVMKSIGLDPDNRWLAVSSDDGSKTRAIEPLGDKDATVYPSWSPNNQTIAMYTEGIDFDRQEIFFVGLNNENFKSTVIEGRGFQPLWAPEGDKLVYSVYSSKNDLKPMLWSVNAQGESIGSGRKSLGVETWAEKCAFSGKEEVYCAVPENLEEGAGLFPELAKSTSDRLYKINIRTGLKRLVAIPDNDYNMSNLIISDNGYNLYFTNETTKQIHTIKLK